MSEVEDGMTIGDAINAMYYYGCYDTYTQKQAREKAIDTMRKYQMIEQILHDPCIIPEGCYPKLKKIKEVIEDGEA